MAERKTPKEQAALREYTFDPAGLPDYVARLYELLGKTISLMEQTEDELGELDILIKGFIKYCHEKGIFNYSNKKTNKQSNIYKYD